MSDMDGERAFEMVLDYLKDRTIGESRAQDEAGKLRTEAITHRHDLSQANARLNGANEELRIAKLEITALGKLISPKVLEQHRKDFDRDNDQIPF